MQNSMRTTGRWLYAAAGVLALLFAGIVYAWSVLSTPIAAEFPTWSAGQMAVTFTITMIFFCAGGISSSFLLRRVGPAVNLTAAAVLFLTGFLLSAGTHSLVGLYVFFGVFCGTASGLTYNTVLSSVGQQFPDCPGLISGILLMGFGIGSFLVGKVYQALTPGRIGGWRTSFTWIGITTGLILVLYALLTLRISPRTSGQRQSAREEENAVRPCTMLRRKAYWLYFLWTVCITAAGLALMSQATPMALQAAPKIPMGTIVLIVGLISICNGLGRVLVGALIDRIGAPRALLVVSVLLLVASGMLGAAHFFGGLLPVAAGFALAGFSYGGCASENSAYILTQFGRTHYPTNFALVNTLMLPASLGSVAAGTLYDASQSYGTSYLLIAVLAAVSLLTALQIQRTVRTEQ